MSEPTLELLERIAAVLESHRITDFAFTGGVAVGVWAQPRQTRDVDVCGVLPLDEVNRILSLRDGMRTGAEELPDSVRFRVGDWDVDLFVCKDAYDRACLDRAVIVGIDHAKVRVVAVEDLLIHKMIKLRTDRRRILQDAADLRAVIEAQRESIDWKYLQTWLPADEAKLLADAPTIADDELVQRLLHR